ncbi:MAG: hypothetical protein RR101_13905 [Burkholderiaceae bacterium]
MSYTTGTANDMVAVRQALIDACVAGGWIWDAGTEVLSKGAIFVRVSVNNTDLLLFGRSSAGAGEMPVGRRMGEGVKVYSAPAFSWPVQYRIFVFQHEVYCVLQYAVEMFQWLAFGKSSVSGLPGSGIWAEGTAKNGYTGEVVVNMGINSGEAYSYGICPAPFWITYTNGSESTVGDVLHNDLDGGGWSLRDGSNVQLLGVRAIESLLKLLPNAWNSEGVLVPIRAYKIRPSSKASLVGDLEHARYIRVDNYVAAQILTIGHDRWMVFPFLRKNTEQRNGGSSLSHSGTFGWAIRYEGA